MIHHPGFLALVNDAKSRTRQMTIDEYRERKKNGERLVLVDVREDREWDAGRLPDAVHLGRGIVERDIEERYPDKHTPLVFQCGGGFRSALVCDNLQKMGYTHLWSLDGGYKGWIAAGLPIERG